jgi:hypothetical protein
VPRYLSVCRAPQGACCGSPSREGLVGSKVAEKRGTWKVGGPSRDVGDVLGLRLYRGGVEAEEGEGKGEVEESEVVEAAKRGATRIVPKLSHMLSWTSWTLPY